MEVEILLQYIYLLWLQLEQLSIPKEQPLHLFTLVKQYQDFDVIMDVPLKIYIYQSLHGGAVMC